jgi:crossover junction endodeoxyribonuclease RusA
VQLRIDVIGRPAPQGSKKTGAKGQLIESSPHLPAWRKAVRVAAWAAMAAAEIRPHQRPIWPKGVAVAVELTFYVTDSGPEEFPQRITEHGDIDKLERAVLDSLTAAGVWQDDRQVVRVTKERFRATGATGVHILIKTR